MKALIVEGDLMSQCVLAKLLSERGHEVTCFENAEQAILAYQRQAYPLIFVDGELPGMDGRQLCRWLRSQPGGDQAYIMLAHAARTPLDLHQVLSAGASDYLLKPFDVTGLRTRLDVADRQMAGFFRSKKLEEEVARREQEMEAFQAELTRAGEALGRETELRRELEVELEKTQLALQESRSAFDARLAEQAHELSATAERLSSATTFRNKIEDDLKRVRTELEAQLARQTDELEKLRQELAWEKARNRELTADQRKAEEAAQSRFRELTLAERKAEERRQATEAESRRAAEGFGRARAEWEQQQRELVAEVATLRKRIESGEVGGGAVTLERVEAEREAAQQELNAVREEYAKRLGVHTGELLRLDGMLQEALAGRQRVEQDLVKSREELAQKSADYAAAVVRAGEALEAGLARESGDGVRLREELESTRKQLEAETERRQKAEAELNLERARVTERMRRFAAALEPAEGDWVSS